MVRVNVGVGAHVHGRACGMCGGGLCALLFYVWMLCLLLCMKPELYHLFEMPVISNRDALLCEWESIISDHEIIITWQSLPHDRLARKRGVVRSNIFCKYREVCLMCVCVCVLCVFFV